MSAPRGLYTPVYESLPRHPKVIQAAAELAITRPELVGRLVMLWTWALAGLGDEAKAVSAPAIETAAEWPERRRGQFVAALAAAGLLDAGGGDLWLIHEWQEYGGKVAARQRADRARKFHGKAEEPPRIFHGNSVEVPRSFRGDSKTDETRLDETRSDETRSDEKKEITQLRRPELSDGQRVVLDALHEQTARLVFGGADVPPLGWCEDLILAGATLEHVSAAVQAAVTRGVRGSGSLRYIATVLKGEIGKPPRGVPARAAPSDPARESAFRAVVVNDADSALARLESMRSAAEARGAS